MKPTARCNLQSCILCTNSLEGWRSSIAAHKQNRFFKKGQQIFEEGQPVHGIYFLYSGKVKVHMRWGESKELILYFAREGDMIGYRGLGNDNIYPVSATALEPVMVCYVELAFFETSLQMNQALTYRLLKFYANELQEAEKRMRNLAHMEVKGRVADTLLLLKKQFGQDKEGVINISLSRQDIASFAGTTYETVFRTLNELVKEKLIKVSGKGIGIVKEKALAALANNK